MTQSDTAVILADWGNSSGRLYCVKGTSLEPEILAERHISGVKDTKDCPELFSEIAQEWISTHGVKQAFFTGAITSNIGWTNTGYAALPARAADVQQIRVDTDYGLDCRFLSGASLEAGPHDYFDTVRGEDIQAFGWMALTGLTDAVICSPGTHTKWLTLEGGAIASILTGVTGESFEVLNMHSILTRGADTPSYKTEEYARGLAAMMRTPRPAFTHMLMAVRNLQISGELSTERSADYLSGLLTGESCASAHEILPDGPIHITGDGHAAKRYLRALKKLGREVLLHDGQACVIAGLQAVRQFSA